MTKLTPEARLKRRYAAERRFRLMGLGAVLFSALVLSFLLITMSGNALGGFKRSELRFPVDVSAGGLTIDESQLQGPDPLDALQGAGLPDVVQFAAQKALGADGAAELQDGAWREVAAKLVGDPTLLQQNFDVSLPASDDLAAAMTGEAPAPILALAQRLEGQGKLVRVFDWGFLTRGDATGPQAVGIWGALKGSLLTMAVTLALEFRIVVLSAVFMEEYAHKNSRTEQNED
jgi:phosphate transport system permease protein